MKSHNHPAKICLRLLFVVLCLTMSGSALGASIRETRQLLASGQYAKALELATAEVERRSYSEEWPLLKAQAEQNLGQYQQALTTMQDGLTRYTWSIRLRMAVYDLQRILGHRDMRVQMLEGINQLATSAPWRYTDADDLVVLGRAALELGADPRDVLEGFFERARRNYGSHPQGTIASARLALDKQDPALAVDYLRPNLEKFTDNAEVSFLLSEALKKGSAEESSVLLQKTLEQNPHHFDAKLRLVRQAIDRELYEDADTVLSEVFAVNPNLPNAWALKTVLHHLQFQKEKEKQARQKALQFSKNNPEVDYLIGECLSGKYRFAEAVEYLRKSLKIDPDFQEANVQLAQDLLRLGKDDEAWKLVEAARKKDEYSVGVFNLLQLRDSIDSYQTLKDERFVIRMDRQEAEVYGSQVQDLLNEAFDTLSKKYGYVPSEPVIVEIFDRKDDFAVRTFGVPDVSGFLGVCFGKLITANSPASFRNNPNNWNAVLWHEFCHVITLQMTDNRIPRWLSEGTSVYEERQRNGSWGQHFSPDDQHRVLTGKITPVSELSGAFLNAKSGEDVNFAYFESSMVVEFLVQEFGFEVIPLILKELKNGLPINDALGRHTTEIETLDRAFETWFQEQAQAYAKNVSFTLPKKRKPGDPIVERSTDERPDYTKTMQTAADLIQIGKPKDALELLEGLVELFPDDRRAGSARVLLAGVHGKLNQPENQIKQLTEHVRLSASDWDAASTLLQLLVKEGQWGQAVQVGQRVLAIDPLRADMNQLILKAALESHQDQLAVTMLTGLLKLDTANKARHHLQLARLKQDDFPDEARRHVLLSLEHAPRYRAAHEFLLSLHAAEN